jgi:hypothetical protein
MPDSKRIPTSYLIAVLLLPLVVLWRQDNTLFTPPGQIDPWFYLGFFRNLASFKRDLFPGTYYGSRLSWILPGYIVHSLFPSLAANCVLHLGVQSVAVFSLFSTLRFTVGLRSAFLTAIVFCANPQLCYATGWDYADGAGIAYCLLTMALLTLAAVKPVRKWTLFLAGMALAALVYSNLFWIALAPLLPLYYLVLAWAWHRTPLIHAALSLCLWLGAGCVVLSVILGGMNYLLDGNFWFYGPSVAAARGLMAHSNPWFLSIWIDGLAPWLWFTAIAGATAAILLWSQLRSAATGHNAASLLYSGQLLAALAFMGYEQNRGVPVLGIYYYSSLLLPFVFLVIGVSFWPAAEKIGRTGYVLICCVAVVVFGSVWGDYAGHILPIWPAAIPQTALAGGSALAMALVLRRRTAGILLAIAGFAVLTSEVRFTSIAPFTSEIRNQIPIGSHGYRQDYERLMHARERIESIRNGHVIRFWYDAHEPGLLDYYALNSTYLYEYALLSTNFPQGACSKEIEAGSVVVVLSSNARMPDTARSALGDCWRRFGVKPVVAEVDVQQRAGGPYTMAMLKAEADLSTRRPLRAVFNSAGRADLQLVENSTEPVPFPLDRWTVCDRKSDAPTMQAGSRGAAVRTPRSQYAFALTYGPLVAPENGRYRFALQYRPGSGQFCFGARFADESGWLGTDIAGHPAGSHREMAFWVDLKGGEPIFLRIANNNYTGDGAASFLMEEVTAFELLNSSARN